MTKPKMPDAYVVVCTDLHHAAGPYLGRKSATLAARAMTEASACVYLPVLLTLADGGSPVVMGDDDSLPSWEPKGYL